MRIIYDEVEPESDKGIYQMTDYVKKSGLSNSLLDLIYLRASQINGCAYCTDMHTQDVIADGESIQKINCVPVWRDSPFFSTRERTALEFTEALTEVSRNGVSDELYDRVRTEFNEHQYVALVMAINIINSWNRLMISCGGTAGLYKNRKLVESMPGYFEKNKVGSL